MMNYHHYLTASTVLNAKSQRQIYKHCDQENEKSSNFDRNLKSKNGKISLYNKISYANKHMLKMSRCWLSFCILQIVK